MNEKQGTAFSQLSTNVSELIARLDKMRHTLSIAAVALGDHSPPVRARILRLWMDTLKAYRPQVEPEASHFDDLVEWLGAVAEAIGELT